MLNRGKYKVMILPSVPCNIQLKVSDLSHLKVHVYLLLSYLTYTLTSLISHIYTYLSHILHIYLPLSYLTIHIYLPLSYLTIHIYLPLSYLTYILTSFWYRSSLACLASWLRSVVMATFLTSPISFSADLTSCSKSPDRKCFLRYSVVRVYSALASS